MKQVKEPKQRMTLADRLMAAKRTDGAWQVSQTANRTYWSITDFLPFCEPYFRLSKKELRLLPRALERVVVYASTPLQHGRNITAAGPLLGEGMLAAYHTYLTILRARAIWHMSVIEMLPMSEIIKQFQISSAPLTLGIHMWTDIVGRAASAKGYPYMQRIPTVEKAAEHRYRLMNADGTPYDGLIMDGTKSVKVGIWPRAQMFRRLIHVLHEEGISQSIYPV